MRIFLFGSRAINFIPDEAKEIIKSLVIGNEFLIGDCYGCDIAWQSLIRELKGNFKVYHIGKQPRNSLTSNTISVAGNRYSDKDDQMITDCDKAICIIRENSPGSRKNIDILKQLGKDVKIFEVE